MQSIYNIFNKTNLLMKKTWSLLLIMLPLFAVCQQDKASAGSKIKKGMIKVAIMYANGEGKTFNMEYYSTKHMPMAETFFGESLKAMSIDKCLGGAAGAPAPYVAIGYFYFENMEACKKAMANTDKLKADVPNYTNIQPQILISEVQKAE